MGQGGSYLQVNTFGLIVVTFMTAKMVKHKIAFRFLA